MDGVRKAAELGCDGVQIYTVRGEMSPEKMTAQKRGDFRTFCADLGISISALCGDMGGGFRTAADNPRKIERSKQIVDLAADLGTSVVTTHIGVVPNDRDSEIYQALLSACREIAEYGAQKGVTFAVETGPEKATTLRQLLDDVDSAGLGINLDPANLVMVVADDPVQAVYTFGKYIVHTHAKDGIQLRPCDPVQEYHGIPPRAPELGPGFKEVPLGEGGVDWDNYLKALRETGYAGFLTIEREVGESPERDITKAIAFLRRKME